MELSGLLLGVVVLDWLEIRMLHRVAGCYALGVVVTKHLAEQVQRFFGNELVVLRVNELLPRFARLLSEDIIVVAVQCHVVLLDVLEELVCAQHLRYLHQLVVVVLTLKERFLLEYHTGKHAPKRPDVKRVVINLQINQQLGTFEVARSHADIVLLAGMVKLRKTPVDETKLARVVVNHNVVWLNIAVHDALRVAEVKSLKNLEHVIPDVEVRELLIKRPEVNITSIDKLHDEGGSLGHRVTDHVDQVDDVHSVFQCLEDLDFAADFRFFHCSRR